MNFEKLYYKLQFSVHEGVEMAKLFTQQVAINHYYWHPPIADHMIMAEQLICISD